MSVAIGSQVGCYVVRAFIGEGGMGRVFRAHDTKLQREVALKVLPDDFARDSDRVARFQREAQSLAALNHPNIAQIYGVEESTASPCLILELVDGETLQEKLKRGPLPLSETVEIAKQIAEALEAAHARGIIHRDLKPANIKVTTDGKVKVLDFGLARIMQEPTDGADASHSPTMLSRSVGGVILGTAAYMSPEQARGKPLDKRTDIWSFGCVVFEMLTGQPTFAGETVSDTIAKILERQPPLETLPTDIPIPLRNLLRRCLQKNARERLHDIVDAKLELQDVLDAPSPSALPNTEARGSRKSLTVIALIGAVMLAGVVAVLSLTNRSATDDNRVLRFSVLMPPGEVASQVAMAPDGRKMAIYAVGQTFRIWIHQMDSNDVQPLSGSEGAYGYVFWSPDSRQIGYTTFDRKLMRIDASGGAPMVLSDRSNAGGSWNSDGVILFGDGQSLLRVAASGGAVSAVELDDDADSRSDPQFLPDGKQFLYSAVKRGQPNTIRIGSLDSRRSAELMKSDSPVLYSTDGHLLFNRGTTLLAQVFDPGRLALSGNPMPIVQDAFPGSLFNTWSYSTASASTLGYVTTRAGNNGQLTWFDRSGNVSNSIKQPPGVEYLNPVFSPDETRITVNVMEPRSGNWDVWAIELASQIPTRLTTDSAQDSDAVWSHDGKAIVFVSNRNGSFGLYRKTLAGSGSEELIVKTESEPRADDWTADGRFVIYDMNRDIMAVDVQSPDRKQIAVVKTPFAEYGAKTSPDGKWIAYASNETGQYQIYVQPFPGPGERKRVSTVYGIHPRWRADGRELVYWQVSGALMSVDLTYDRNGIQAGSPKPVFPPHVYILDLLDARHHHAMTGDGKRFLLRQAAGPQGPSINVITNWTQIMRK